DPVARWMMAAADGTLLAVSTDDAVQSTRLSGRDYFHGALAAAAAAGRPAVHVSRAYLSQNQRLYTFGVSAAVRDAGGTVLGVVAVTLATGPTLGPRLVEAGQEAVLALPAHAHHPRRPATQR